MLPVSENSDTYKVMFVYTKHRHHILSIPTTHPLHTKNATEIVDTFSMWSQKVIVVSQRQ
jgi:hypothetical protein